MRKNCGSTPASSTATTRVRFLGNDIHGKPQVYGVHTGEDVHNESVRISEHAVERADTQRYEFTPALRCRWPLITDAGKSGT